MKTKEELRKEINDLEDKIKPLQEQRMGLGEGGLIGCSKFAECFCPLLPNPCYNQ